MTSAFPQFNGTFSYILADTLEEKPFYLRNNDATQGQMEFNNNPPDFTGWIIEIDNVATNDFAAFYGPAGTELPPTNVGLYTQTPPPGNDPSTRVVTLVSITPVH